MHSSDVSMRIDPKSEDDYDLGTDFYVPGSESTFDGVRYVTPRTMRGRKVA